MANENTGHRGEWIRTEEVKPYPKSRYWEYVRAVSTHKLTGARSVSGWARRLKAKKGAL